MKLLSNKLHEFASTASLFTVTLQSHKPFLRGQNQKVLILKRFMWKAIRHQCAQTFFFFCILNKKEYHSGCKIINLLCLKERMQKRWKIEAEPEVPREVRWPPRLFSISHNSSTTATGSQLSHLRFQKGIQLFW